MGFNLNMKPDGHTFVAEKGGDVEGFTYHICCACGMEAYRFGTATYMKVKDIKRCVPVAGIDKAKSLMASLDF